MNNIYLIGMMGCGKSTIGELLARESKWPFVDLDASIEKNAGMAIKEIFAQCGEDCFREQEKKELEKVAKGSHTIVSCGGGVVLDSSNIELMHSSGTIVYIYRDIEEIIRSVETKNRPLLKDNGSNVRAIYENRKHIYETACDLQILNEDSLDQVVHEMRCRLSI